MVLKKLKLHYFYIWGPEIIKYIGFIQMDLNK